MSCVCGVDTGSFRTPSHVAWCNPDKKYFYLDQYIPSAGIPLPVPPPHWPEPAYIGIDAPQGLPLKGEKMRLADREAGVPTKTLPRDREELAGWKLYKGLIEAGVEIFWSVYRNGMADIPGLESNRAAGTTVFETYPRYVIKRLWPELKIPSKSKEPFLYSTEVYRLIRQYGFNCPGLLRPSIDQVDSMLCALAAYSFQTSGELPSGTVGRPPFADKRASVLREGLIVAP
ncbi:MAG TPA: DUF429 domain-containing protein [archaeon]|nr:DUF429 domain-containing protein [archaeon]